jgi:peptidoglycan/LPS O-acetylase OafA/YrhL
VSPVAAPPRRRTAVRSVLVDLLAVLVFAAIGRRSHAEGITAAGVASTAWPFATGAAAGWVAARGWRAPTSVRAAGVPVWVGAVVGGMLLRRATATSFVVVTSIFLGTALLGWRAVAGRRRT